jgi:hypothetical protein
MAHGGNRYRYRATQLSGITTVLSPACSNEKGKSAGQRKGQYIEERPSRYPTNSRRPLLNVSIRQYGMGMCKVTAVRKGNPNCQDGQSKAVAFNLFCSLTSSCNFSSTLCPKVGV